MKQQQRVGPYEFVRPLGAGGQGSVWLASDTRNGARVAIKMLPPGNWGAVELGRLRRESRLLLTFCDPGLPAGIGVIEDAEQHVYGFVMQYVEGTPLNLALREPLAGRQAAAVSTELARILSVLHIRGVVHRDVKMANVIVRPGWQAGDQGSVMLVDLGIARGLESSAAGAYAAGMMVGSAPYVAPELLAPAGELGPAGALDTFALGVLTFLLLFRRHPTGLPMTAGFDEFLQAWRTTGVVYPEPERVAAINAEVPGLLQVAEKCMAFSPRDRFANALRLYDALRVLVEQPARPAPAPAEELAAPPAASVSAPSPAPMVAPPPVTADSESDKWKTLAVVLAGFIAVAAATIAGVIWVLR